MSTKPGLGPKCKTLGCNNIKQVGKSGSNGAYCRTCRTMRKRAKDNNDSPDKTRDELKSLYWDMREKQP